jgi:hypothetical protein
MCPESRLKHLFPEIHNIQRHFLAGDFNRDIQQLVKYHIHRRFCNHIQRYVSDTAVEEKVVGLRMVTVEPTL